MMMPTIKVEIAWDKPDDKNWLNVYNIKIALSDYCKNTNFIVKDLEGGNNSEEQPIEP